MKYILEIILTIIIVFFLWNILKRLFFTTFYKFPTSRPQEDVRQQKTKKNLDSRVNWDAETVDYEEIKETGDKK